MIDFFDPDIAAMSLSDMEKNGLQVYRNYSRAFDEDRAKKFASSVQSNPKSLANLCAIHKLILQEEARTLPVLACAYADDQLKEMFRREIPDDVPGGRSELLSGFGPLSRLSQRVQMAYAFGWLSNDVLVEINHLRKLRNDVSHKWDIKLLEEKLSQLIEQHQFKVEQFLGDGVRLPEEFHKSLNPIQKLRIRLIWLLGRITYETCFWVPALKHNLVPHKILYGKNAPAMLTEVAAACVSITLSGILQTKDESSNKPD